MKLIPDFKKRFFNIIMLELITVSLFIIIITAIRFINADLFNELKAVYEKYMLVETDISLVLGGEEN